MRKRLSDVDIKNKTVIVRCDFNVPVKEGKIIDNTRIVKSLETIKYCIKENAKIILLSHLGRVKTEADKKEKTLKPVAEELEKLLRQKVIFVPQTRGEEVEKVAKNLKAGEILLLENTRFEDIEEKRESGNDPSLGAYWASLADVFVNDAFGTAHRAHASNVGIASHIKTSCIGLLIEKELEALEQLNCPEKPFIVVLGGAKVGDKIGVIENIVEKADKILIGGGMAFTFLKAEGYEIGNSLYDADQLSFCEKITKKYPEKIILPVDLKVTSKFSNDTPTSEKDLDEMDFNDIGLDIGKNTVEIFKHHLTDAKLVLWNGPLGVYELAKYKEGTDDLLEFLAESKIKTILGGGDIVAAATSAKVTDRMYHISTGGGATLEYLEGKSLPGIDAIK